MITRLLFMTTVVSACGWLVSWVASAALAKYIKDKGYTPPSDEEMKACCTYVWKKLLKIH